MAKKEVKKKVEKKATKASLAKPSGKSTAKNSSPAKAASPKSSSTKVAAGNKITSKKGSAADKLSSSPVKSQNGIKAVTPKLDAKEKPNSKAGVKSELSKKELISSAEQTPASASKNKVAKVAVERADSTSDIDSSESSVPSKKAKKYEASTEEETRWLELRDKYKSTKALPYKMSEVYAEKTPIDHKVLGWGFILSVLNDRLEVLFQSGIKQLISNYKSNN